MDKSQFKTAIYHLYEAVNKDPQGPVQITWNDAKLVLDRIFDVEPELREQFLKQKTGATTT